jgi:hypothetical protein
VLDDILVPHELLKGRKTIIVPRQVMSKENFLVAMDVNKGQLDAYSGIEIDAKGEVVKYIRGAVQLKDKSTQARLRYNVDFLQSPNSEVSYSAHLELRRAVTTSYADLRKVAETLKPEPLLKALADDKTPAEQRGTFGMLLGHCGKKEDAAALRKLIDASWDERPTVNSPELLFGYAVLDPEAGWSLLMSFAEQKDKHFLHRYAALQTVRRLGANRPELVDAKKLTAGTARFLKTADMADFAIEDLRKLNRWEYCDAILDLPSKPGYEKSPIVRKAVIRFALECPSAIAKAYVQVERNRDPEYVAETEELLALEKTDAIGPRK